MSNAAGIAARAKRPHFLPFSRPTIEDDEIAEVVECLRSGWITSGPRVLRFEQMFRTAQVFGDLRLQLRSESALQLHFGVAPGNGMQGTVSWSEEL